MPKPTVAQQLSSVATDIQQTSSGLSMLSWIGGIATLAGIVALVLSRGSIGMRAILIGVALCVLNFIVATYADLILIPVLVITGVLSISWGYITWKQFLKHKECKDE